MLCGSIVAACSGTIDTPTEENPPRSSARQTPAPTTPNRTGSTTTPRAPTPPADDEEDEEDETPPPPPPATNPTTPAAEDEEDPPAAPIGDLSFESDIWPIFNSKCGPCHVDLGLGGQNIGASNKGAAFDESVDLEEAILSEIETGEMPPACASGAPGDPSCLSVDDAAKVEAWYEAGAPE